MTEAEKIELALLRELREAVDDLEVVMLFRVKGGTIVSPAERIEVSVRSHDDVRDAVGQIEAFESDRAEGDLSAWRSYVEQVEP